MSAQDEPGRGSGFAAALGVGVLALDGALLAVFGPLFNPLYRGALPLPMGALLTILVMPWLVGQAAEIDPRRWAAAAPLLAWAVTIPVVGFAGPGGDVLLPDTWQTLLLCAGGLAAGVFGLWRAGAQRW